MWQMIQRELLLAFRQRSSVLNPLLFFVLVCALFPLAISANIKLLQTIGAGVIWVAALLAMMLSMRQLFLSDYLDGSLDLIRLSPKPLLGLIYGKIVSHWLIFSLPLLLVLPVIGLLFNLSWQTIGVLWCSLLLGTPTLIFIGSIAAALTVSLRNSGLLMALILLPLYVPVLIFGASLVVAFNSGLPVNGIWSLLVVFLVVAASFSPLAVLAILRL